MITFLLVDDERIEREGLRFLLERRFADLAFLEAVNGQDALSILADNPVDVMITDIKMPFIDGLALTEKARALYPNLQIIIYTAYSEFDYAYRAIKYGVSNFLLKPIVPNDFYEEIEKVLAQCGPSSIINLMNRMERERIWYDLIHGKVVDEAMCSRSGWDNNYFENQQCVLVLAIFEDEYLAKYIEKFESEVGAEISCSWILDASRILILLADMHSTDSAALQRDGQHLQDVIIERLHVRPTLMLAPVGNVENLHDVYRFLDELCSERLFGWGKLILLSDNQKMWDSDLQEPLVNIHANVNLALQSSDQDAVRVELDTCAQFFNSLVYAPARPIKVALVGILQSVCDAITCLASKRLGWFNQIWDAADVQTLVKVIEDCMNELPTRADYELPSEKTIEQIIELIHEHFADNLTLDDAARAVYMTPTYVSFLFKQCTGVTFIKYLTDYRLKRSAHLLASSTKRITDIMQETGYSNSSYFSYVFRAKFGVTPSQYRKNLREDAHE